jgi:hypothetical protein
VYAWELAQTQTRLRVLRQAEWEDAVLAALAFLLALAASEVLPAFAFPLTVAAVAAAFLAVHAFWRHWELVDRLLLDRDAYQIREVRRRAERSATMANRQLLATSIRSLLKEPGYASPARVRAAAEDLQMLAAELDDPGLSLDPACAVACDRFVIDGGASPLYNPALPADDTAVRVRQIRAGFEPRH